MPHECWTRMFLVAILLAGSLAAPGCSKKEADEKLAEKAMEGMLERATGEKTEIDIDGQDVSIKTGDGTVDMKAATEWPRDMFEVVPRFTYGKVERVTSATEEGMKKFNVWLHDVPDDASEKYHADLKAAGWEAQMAIMGPNASMLTAQKGKIAVQLMHGKEDKTAVVVAFEVNE